MKFIRALHAFNAKILRNRSLVATSCDVLLITLTGVLQYGIALVLIGTYFEVFYEIFLRSRAFRISKPDCYFSKGLILCFRKYIYSGQARLFFDDLGIGWCRRRFWKY
jgi:hypothetical protein